MCHGKSGGGGKREAIVGAFVLCTQGRRRRVRGGGKLVFSPRGKEGNQGGKLRRRSSRGDHGRGGGGVDLECYTACGGKEKGGKEWEEGRKRGRPLLGESSFSEKKGEGRLII